MGRLSGRGLPSRLRPVAPRFKYTAPERLEAREQRHPFAGRAGSRLRDGLAVELVARQGGRCRMCGCSVDVSLRGKSSPHAAVVDHLVPWRLRPDAARDLENLQLICRRCHAVCDSIEGRLWPDAEAIAEAKRARAHGEGG